MLAFAALLTLFIDAAAVTAVPLAPLRPLFGSDVLVLVMVEVIFALVWAFTVSWPLALTVVSSMVAVASDGFSVPKTLPPSKASRALNRTFSDSQPMVLKASVTPTAVV